MIKFGQRGDRITSLSGGNQQKVLIGRGFAMRPDVIVLNDPARGIDVGAKTELYRHLRNFANEGKSVVYMSSELEEFLGFATRVIVFRDGAPFDAFDGRQLDPKKVLEAMFGQTDRSGLKAPYGPTPSRSGATRTAVTSTVVSEGVRVRVAVPDHLKPLAKPDFVKVHVAATPVPSAPKASAGGRVIRIVEFDAQGRVRGEEAR